MIVVEVVVRLDIEALPAEEAPRVAAECVEGALEEWNTTGFLGDVSIVSSRVCENGAVDGGTWEHNLANDLRGVFVAYGLDPVSAAFASLIDSMEKLGAGAKGKGDA